MPPDVWAAFLLHAICFTPKDTKEIVTGRPDYGVPNLEF
jgi:hypothetical protein